MGALTSCAGLAPRNAFLTSNGFDLSTAGGQIKGSPDVYLEQSSTLTEPVQVTFKDKTHTIPACYYGNRLRKGPHVGAELGPTWGIG